MAAAARASRGETRQFPGAEVSTDRLSRQERESALEREQTDVWHGRNPARAGLLRRPWSARSQL